MVKGQDLNFNRVFDACFLFAFILQPVSIITPLLTLAMVSNNTNNTKTFKNPTNIQPPVISPAKPETPSGPNENNLISFNKSDESESSLQHSTSFGNHRDSLQRNVDSKKFYSLVNRKKSTTNVPHFYSMRVCKKHINKKNPVRTVSDILLSELKCKAVEKSTLFDTKSTASIFQPTRQPSIENLSQNAQTRKIVKNETQTFNENFYENLTDSIQILEQNIVAAEKTLEACENFKPQPAPRKKLAGERVYQNVPGTTNLPLTRKYVAPIRALKAKCKTPPTTLPKPIPLIPPYNRIGDTKTGKSMPVIVGGKPKTPPIHKPVPYRAGNLIAPVTIRPQVIPNYSTPRQRAPIPQAQAFVAPSLKIFPTIRSNSVQPTPVKPNATQVCAC